MKKLVSLLLVFILACTSVICVNAEGFEITDEFLNAVHEEYDNNKIEKDDINIITAFSFDEYRHIVQYEVDGYEYHKEDTVQASRDLLKNHIMELYEIPLLRFKTNGSGEKEKIIEMLDKLVG